MSEFEKWYGSNFGDPYDAPKDRYKAMQEAFKAGALTARSEGFRPEVRAVLDEVVEMFHLALKWSGARDLTEEIETGKVPEGTIEEYKKDIARIREALAKARALSAARNGCGEKMSHDPDLLPCPFCGGIAQYKDEGLRVHCSECGSRTSKMALPYVSAATVWNSRNPKGSLTELHKAGLHDRAYDEACPLCLEDISSGATSATPAPSGEVAEMVKTITEWRGSTIPIGIAREAAALLSKVERQLSLAQTENAGHIRIEDELKLDLAQAQARIETLLKKVHQ